MTTDIVPFFSVPENEKPRAALFMSGTGSNAERILERCRQAGGECPFSPVALVTDCPETSRAREIGTEFSLPVIENDIREFYRKRGLSRMTIRTEQGREARKAWTDEIRTALKPFDVTFGILAGFVPLTNLTGDFPCLNVHPGDLTYLKEGRRYLVGLHTIPVERAILEGLDSMRSSVIVAQPYEGGGDNMDSGPILGISEAVTIDLDGYRLERLDECLKARPEKRPKGGFGDLLETIADKNLEALKVNGDWRVFPRVVFDFARGFFGLDTDGELCYRLGGQWHPVETIIFGDTGREIVFREA
jgi:folate-dependent phosphoribosylglycinamide formyltransferase PurN